MKFTKGHIPWNKGVKGIHLSPQTEFKKGKVAPTKGRKFPERQGKNNPGWKGGEETRKKRKRISDKKYYKMNKEKCLEGRRKWKTKHRDEINRKIREKRKEPKEHLNHVVSRAVQHSLKKTGKRGCKWEILLGYPVEKLKKHLGKQFEPWMNWSNFGKGGWEIDHIIPKASFNFTNPNDIDFKKCWALENLRPLEQRKNASKGKKLINLMEV